MTQTRQLPQAWSLFLAIALAPAPCVAHPGHGEDNAPKQASAGETHPTVHHEGERLTGSGDLRFKYREDLSELPEEIAAGIKPAHGGFAVGPEGEIYFGLEGTGVVRVSPDLREKTIVCAADEVLGGGLHNTTYLDRSGGLLVLPDNNRGKIHFVRTSGEYDASIGRPAVNDYYKNADNKYAPTDAELVGETLYVCDGYSAGKYVLTVDLGSMQYKPDFFGGKVSGEGREEGKFSTNHGVTLDPRDGSLLIADRERRWVQRMTTGGEFVEGVELNECLPCDTMLVDWRGERLMVVGCLWGEKWKPGVVQILRDKRVVSTLRPKDDLGLESFKHIHNAIAVVVDGKLFVLCYGWNPGCYAVLEHVPG